MESTEVIIARLVLGYLKEERCRSSYKEFLKTSNHLQNHRLLNMKYIPTRFLGLTLEDILTEYLEISQIVQGRLESTSYYNEHHPKNSLLQQVLYLMNRVQHSTISTPCPRSPEDMQIGTSPSQGEQLSDVETTPAHTLPGNVQYESEESVGLNTPNRNGHKYAHISDNSPQAEQGPAEVIDTEELAKSLLENKEFHEKIAKTINKVAEKKHRVSEELDKTIKTVVKETEQDPIFDQILDDIIGSSGILDNNKGQENNSMTSCTKENIEHKQKKSTIEHYSEQNVSTGMYPVNQENLGNPEPTHSTYGNSVKPQNFIGKDSNEVIVFNGPLENYLGSTSITNTNFTQPQPMPMQNPLYINTPCSGLLPSATTCSGLMMPSIPSTSQIVLLNQQTQAPWQTAAPYLSEQDIMAMPTVIVNDTSNAVYVVSGMQKPKPILPMPIIEVPNLHEYLNFHNKPAANNPPKKGLKKVIYPVSAQKSVAPPVTGTVNQNASSENKLPDLSEDVITENKNGRDPVVKTPPPVETIRKKTPKSGSHIRNLDFSTPPKVTSSHEKKSNKSPRKTSHPQKKQAAKSLFQKEETPNKESDKPKKIWDHHLRVGIPYISPPRIRKNRKKAKKAKLNTTAQDAALLEAALQTPVKKESETQEGVVKTPVKAEIETKETPSSVKDEPATQQATKTQEDTGEDASKESKPESTDDKQEPDKKTILSPSKINNSKRNTMTVKGGDAVQGMTPIQSTEPNSFPMKANRNITPMLETPLKDRKLPKTPGGDTPCDHNFSISGFTPFSKMLEANLKGIDINSLPTPSMPITPTFPPFTPNVELASPYSNRPTDYSTGGSSYYVPSDNEQNKSLEAHLKEEEKKPTTKAQKEENLRDIFNKNVIGKKNLSLMKPSVSSPSSCSDSSSDKEDNWVDKESNDTIIFNKKDTPRKSYSLRTRKIPEAAATEQKSRAKAPEKEKKKPTEVKKEKVVKGRRTSVDKKDRKKEARLDVTPNTDQNSSVSEEEKRQEILDMVRDCIKIENIPEEKKATRKPKTKPEKVEENAEFKVSKERRQSIAAAIEDEKAALLRSLEEKRQRMIESMESVVRDSAQPSKATKKGKFKIKPVPNLTSKRKKPSPKKPVKPRKTAPAPKPTVAHASVLHSDLYDSDESDITLRLSPCQVDVKPEHSASDAEAQNLIEGMKERGILLIHNKSPKKKDCAQAEDSQPEEMNCSATIDTMQRDTYDKRVFESEDLHIVYDETIPRNRDEDLERFKDPNSSFIGKVYLEEIGEEIDVQLKFTECISLLDLPASYELEEKVKVAESSGKIIIHEVMVIEPKQENKMMRSLKEEHTAGEHFGGSVDAAVEDALMDYAATGNDDPKLASPKSARKRKLSGDSEDNTDKATKYLKRLDVDQFLNNIHAETNFHVKK